MSVAAQITGAVLPVNGVLGRFYTELATDVNINPYGLVAQGYDTNGSFAEYVFLRGVASTAVGDFVTYDELGVSARCDTGTAASILGPVAIALSANVLSTTGAWYMITGSCPGNVASSLSDNSVLYFTAVAGRVDDASGAAADKQVFGAISRSTDSSNLATIQLSRAWGGIKMS